MDSSRDAQLQNPTTRTTAPLLLVGQAGHTRIATLRLEALARVKAVQLLPRDGPQIDPTCEVLISVVSFSLL